MRVPTAVLLAGLLCIGSVSGDSWEEPRTFEAKDVLPPELVKGEHYEVADEVRTTGYFYAFTLRTDFGELAPVGLDLLRKRVEETQALVALQEVSKTEVFIDAAGQSLASVGLRLVDVLKDPGGTVEGLGPAIDRFRMHLGRESSRVADSVGHHDPTQERKSTVETTKSVANSALGVNKAARRWAQKLQVDPYSRNAVLQKALMAVARIDAAGSLAAKIAVPIPPVVSAVSSVSRFVWGKDPEELRKANEAGLKALGVSDEVAAEFLRNDAFTPTDQTRFVAALAAVKAKGLVDYVGTARNARSPREALFFVTSAEMLKRQHAESAVSAVLTDSRAMVALLGGRAVVLFPLDYVAWTDPFAATATEIAGRARKELGATGLEMQVTGQVSTRARREVQALGWTLKEGGPDGSRGGRDGAQSPAGH